MPISRNCSCCHEAGHAVAWVVNGDRLLLVVGYRDAPMTPEQQRLCYGAITGRSSVEIANDCYTSLRTAGRTIRSGGPSCSQCGGEETGEDYQTCMTIITGHVMCIFAGGAATAHLLGKEHDDAQSTDDRLEAKKLLQRFLKSEQARQDVSGQAKQHASNLVRREAKAIGALSLALLETGVLEGAEAEKIIKENLTTVT
jgi:hypothetical protein